MPHGCVGQLVPFTVVDQCNVRSPRQHFSVVAVFLSAVAAHSLVTNCHTERHGSTSFFVPFFYFFSFIVVYLFVCAFSLQRVTTLSSSHTYDICTTIHCVCRLPMMGHTMMADGSVGKDSIVTGFPFCN